jgi:uncharacterized Zn-finger protein
MKSETADIPFIDPPEVILVDKKRVVCDGGGGALGHPRVYMEMGQDDHVECGYCDRRFQLRVEPGDGHVHAADPGERAAPGVVGTETNHPSRV